MDLILGESTLQNYSQIYLKDILYFDCFSYGLGNTGVCCLRWKLYS